MEYLSNFINITFKSPGELVLKAGFLEIYWYGVIIAAAFLAGLGISLYIAEKQNINPDRIINMSIFLLAGGIVFARLYYVIFSWEYFAGNPLEIFMIWRGGLSIHGVIIGCFFLLWAYTKINSLSLFKYTDLFACALPLGQAIGRWGNFFNSEAFGVPTDFFIRVFIPLQKRPFEYIGQEYFHPTFFYESVWNLVVFLILFSLIRPKFIEKKGVLTLSYLVLYSIGRFFIEDLRTDNIFSIWGLHIAQFISLLLIITGIWGLIVIFCRNKTDKKNIIE